MTRLYGRAPRGPRVRESVPRNYGAQTSIISAVALEGAQATMTIAGAGDTDTFHAYIAQVLRPTMRSGAVIVRANRAAHRASRLATVAEECGAQVRWRASYSPAYSPIALLWAKSKPAVRAATARTAGELKAALGAAWRLVPIADCCGWFSHCGYQVTRKCN
jgi:transposase